MNIYLQHILSFLNKNRGIDFSGYRTAMIQSRIDQRVHFTHCSDTNEYLSYLKKTPHEIDTLIDTLTINVSHFFRNTFVFEYLQKLLLPTLLQQKKFQPHPSLRIWSCGCAMGEEAYSMAMLINECMEKEKQLPDINIDIFATDLDANAIKKAKKAMYLKESIKNIKYGLVEKYFLCRGDAFQLLPFLKQRVSFSVYDILDQKSYAPPESIFGSFDMVLCRNVLIYFNTECQDKIFNKLYRSLNTNGYLILGEAETPPTTHQNHFKKVNEWCHIYQKR
ncbi:chemotaxis protein methyltransferase CheR [Desulfocicer vacuolatum DSM 3385]|uniref:protein-glutamate O-methyltransferase n=1 Tax=Desulfocicer vacuolatum DSM 3385 TaxID=1121400 RepID=A0A1W2CB46_9BACT|nr:protein-glutamate O-methyltransferase CheR [Desulfocicer vacuolatum]SMC82092.1 chemotaxis protein methyltransferase CheR [Desulfocicer vacuolatum DSM 3385]